MIETMEVALTSPEFRVGVLSGAVGLMTSIAAWRARRGSVQLGGISWVAAATVGLAITRGVSPLLILGLSLVGAAGLAGRRLGYWFQFLLCATGGWLIAGPGGPAAEVWVPWLVFAVIVIGAPLTAKSNRHLEPPRLSTVLWGVSVLGVYGTVPDTEEALVLVGAVTPLMLLAVLDAGRFHGSGSYAAVALLAWTTATGGIGRPASIVGGLACLGVFLVAPLARGIRSEAVRSWSLLLLTHLAVVAIASRVAGLRTSALEAAVISIGALLLGLVTLVVAGEIRARRVTVPDSRAASS